jgi:transposase InsO family protein
MSSRWPTIFLPRRSSCGAPAIPRAPCSRGLVYHCVYHTRDEAKADVFFYIESFYNRRRCHSALDYLGLEAYEQFFYRQVLTFA